MIYNSHHVRNQRYMFVSHLSPGNRYYCVYKIKGTICKSSIIDNNSYTSLTWKVHVTYWYYFLPTSCCGRWLYGS